MGNLQEEIKKKYCPLNLEELKRVMTKMWESLSLETHDFIISLSE